MKGSIIALLILILFSIALFLYSGCAGVSPGPDGGSGQVSTPTFSVPAGTYETNQNVTLACSTSGATIYYTLDGSTPTTSSNVYSSPITIPGDENTVTIKTFAAKS